MREYYLENKVKDLMVLREEATLLCDYKLDVIEARLKNIIVNLVDRSLNKARDGLVSQICDMVEKEIRSLKSKN